MEVRVNIKYKKYADIIEWILVLILLTISITFSVKYYDKKVEEHYIKMKQEKSNIIKPKVQNMPSRGKIDRYSEQKLIVTAYSLDYGSCGKHPWEKGYAITASGKKINKNITSNDGIIAAPKEFPFGTKMEIDGWGPGIVYDRGGAVRWDETTKMFHLDIFFNTREEAMQWGKQIVIVKIY